MSINPRGQHEIHRYIRNKEKDSLKEALQKLSESEALGIIQWADLPGTKKFRKFLALQETVVDKQLKANDWDFETGRGLCFLLIYLGLLDRFIGEAERVHK